MPALVDTGDYNRWVRGLILPLFLPVSPEIIFFTLVNCKKKYYFSLKWLEKRV